MLRVFTGLLHKRVKQTFVSLNTLFINAHDTRSVFKIYLTKDLLQRARQSNHLRLEHSILTSRNLRTCDIVFNEMPILLNICVSTVCIVVSSYYPYIFIKLHCGPMSTAIGIHRPAKFDIINQFNVKRRVQNISYASQRVKTNSQHVPDFTTPLKK